MDSLMRRLRLVQPPPRKPKRGRGRPQYENWQHPDVRARLERLIAQGFGVGALSIQYDMSRWGMAKVLRKLGLRVQPPATVPSMHHRPRSKKPAALDIGPIGEPEPTAEEIAAAAGAPIEAARGYLREHQKSFNPFRVKNYSDDA